MKASGRSSQIQAFAAGLLAALATTAIGDTGISMRSIMQQIDHDTRRAIGAVMVEDWAELEKAALAILDNPRPSLRERLRIVSALGSKANGFRSLDSDMSNAAAGLAKAARSRNSETAVESMNTMLRACVACHAQFRTDAFRFPQE